MAHKRDARFTLDLARTLPQDSTATDASGSSSSSTSISTSNNSGSGELLSGYDATFRGSADARTARNPEALAQLKSMKAWEMALAPAKSVPMNGFMMWMAGNSIHIFSIMITVMMLITPVKAIFSTGTTFAKLTEDGKSQLLQQKLVFILANCLSIGMAMYKFSVLGLLPTSPSDWLSFLDPKQILEVSVGSTAAAPM
ncbi:ER membrane DUF1077 domain-containing protein [Capsaspora owczarzaki ATCC 30864]|nr:ER membrane DUF1077 domain-containing protein [Capsaspora owczarzaki ATCC 30864]|eukprot:XP_004344430.1 ER membrane DUF1077 domain-containing protein [Capsaspora owczarzaki ATCC 30864]